MEKELLDKSCEEYEKKPCEFTIKDGVLTKVDYLIYKTELVIPEGVIRISDNAFDVTETEALERIIFPSTLIDIGEENFIDIENLKEVIINENFIFEDDCLYTKDYKKLCFCLKDTKTKKELKVKEGCEHICNFAFNHCDNIRKIVLPESVKQIGDWSFSDCANLNEVVMPKNIDFIGEVVFANSHEIERINLPENIVEIPQELLYSCSLKELKIPDSVKKIEENEDGFAFIGNPYTRIFLSKENKELENYFIKHGLIFEYDNAEEFEYQQAKNLCIELGVKFRKLFEDLYINSNFSKEEMYLSKLQCIFNEVVVMKIKGQGYLFDNQIRKWFLTNEQEIPFKEKEIKFQRYYDRFCSYLTAWKSSIEAVIGHDDWF